MGLVNGKVVYVLLFGILYCLDKDLVFVVIVLKEVDVKYIVCGIILLIWGMLCYVIILVSIKNDMNIGFYVLVYDIDDEVV